MRREKRRKVWLVEAEILRMFTHAQVTERDWLLMMLMRYGLRCGEIVGGRLDSQGRGLPGIMAEDLRTDGIWIKGKGYEAGIVQDRLVPLPPELLEKLRRFAPKTGKLFPVDEKTAERLVKKYARLAGIEDWDRVGPHRLRAFFATDAKEKGYDAFTIRDLMRHKNITTTNLYVGPSSKERLSRVVAEISGLVQQSG